MSLLTRKEIIDFSTILAPLEAEEPLLCAWRYHLRKGERDKESRDKYAGLIDSARLLKYTFKRKKKALGSKLIVLMITNAPSASGSIIPLLLEMKRKGIRPFLLVSSQTRKLAEDLGFHDLITIYDFVYGYITWREYKEAKLLSRHYLHEIKRLVGSEYSCSERWLVQGLAAKKAACRVIETCRFAFGDADKESVEKGMFLGLLNNNIKCAILQHGFFDERLFPIHARYHFDWGPYFSEKALSYGHPAERSVSLGCPRFDPLEKLKVARAAKTERRAGKPSVLAISNVHAYDIYPEVITSFFDSVKALVEGGFEVSIRRHPAETSMDIYMRFLGPGLSGKCRFIEAGEDLYGAMASRDLVYQAMSASSIEAMLLGIPVLWQESEDGNPFWDIPSMGGGVIVDRTSIADAAMSLGNESRDRSETLLRQEGFLEKAVMNRGRSTKAIADYIEESCSMTGKG